MVTPKEEIKHNQEDLHKLRSERVGTVFSYGCPVGEVE